MARYVNRTSPYDSNEEKKRQSESRNRSAAASANNYANNYKSSSSSSRSSSSSSGSSGGSSGTAYGTWSGSPNIGPHGEYYYPVQGDDGRYYYNTPQNHYDSYDSGADASLLPPASQAIVNKAKQMWEEARQRGDQAGMDRAHAMAEAERAKVGYSGGANGGAYNILWKEDTRDWSGGSSYGSGYSESAAAPAPDYTNYTSKYQDQIDELTKQLMDARQEQFTYREAPAYTNRYKDQIDELSKLLLNRPDFSYNPESDPTYQQYKQSYTGGGQRAMQDTLGQVSARTGGLASSYAESAAQQTYNGYMSALADTVPELKQLAYQMYLDEWNGKRSELSTLQGLEQSDYNKYLSQLSQYNVDRNLAYNSRQSQLANIQKALDSLTGLDQIDYSRHRDQISDQRYADETAYNRAVYADKMAYDRAAYADQTAYNRAVYDDETAYNRGLYADQTAYNRGVYADETAYNRGVYADETDYNRKLQRAKQLAESGDFSGYKDLGYSDAEVQRLQAAFMLQHPEMASLFYTGGYGGFGGYTGYGGHINTYMGVDPMGNVIPY